MEKILQTPRLCGVVRAPSSKSEAHRALITAALSALYGGDSTVRKVRCTDLNQDIEATVRCLCALGAEITREGEDYLVTPITALPREAVLDCGESGSTLRFLLPVCCALGATAGAPDGFTVSLVGHGRLPERPLSPLYEELAIHGAILSPMGTKPLIVKGKLTAGDYAIDGGVSSQFISGLLFALPLLNGDSTLSVTGRIESVPYIDMTVDAITRVTGALGGDLPAFAVAGRASSPPLPLPTDTPAVGGDWSGAAFFLTAGVLCETGCSVTLTGLDMNSRQGDKAIVDILRKMGGQIQPDAHGDLTARRSQLRGCVIDAQQVPDLVPILAVAASVAEGETRIVGAARLRLKESDRLKTVSDMISALGGNITETDDGLIIRGVPRLKGGIVDAAGDHRIAMSGAVAATVCTGSVTVVGAESVAKSYPAFWEEFGRLTKE
ncbi:MAG: 3-phosphoshikimate 1-carboxyvinyltransferase [Clostridia bacterium]|nr:3-phosphoshikimate 1-carboxyvinyltransferase [Clostridia bacterium]